MPSLLPLSGNYSESTSSCCNSLWAADSSKTQIQTTPEEEEYMKFVRVVLGQTEDIWGQLFKKNGQAYREPKLVVFRGSTVSRCGKGEAAMGPFYCPADQKVYLDLGFFTELAKRHQAPGDFAAAYVVAHEVGHHVQNLTGVSGKVQKQRTQVSKEEGNKLSVRLELQADFLAGVWAHHAHKEKDILEQGDIEEALVAANAIGDDHLQKKGRGYVVPDSFTHGTSEQRMRWFMKGLKTGDLNLANGTFETPYEQL